VLTVHNFSFGALTPVLGYLMSFVGSFIGLRCTTRAYAYQGRARARWLILAAISIGTTGCWVMHFIAMLGYSIPGMTIRYNVPITIGSMVIAVIVVGIGLFIVGFGAPTWRNLAAAGVFTGVGVASMHYSGMQAMEMPASMSYQPGLFALSILVAVVAATAALWFALRLRSMWHTLGASLIMGVAISGMHYTGMAAMQVRRPTGPVMAMTGPTAAGFLLPLIIGIGVVSIIMTAVLMFSANEDEIREDQQLMERINSATARLAGTPVPTPPAAPAARWPGNTSAWTPSSSQNGAAGPHPPNGEAGPAAPDPRGRRRRSGRPGSSADPGQWLIA
jgi:NO-binding membrane sensor protein with MHYT domain